MKQKQTDCILLGISIGSFLLMSVSFVLMPIEKLNFLPGILFWAGLILGVTLQIVLGGRRRKFFASYKVKPEKMQKPRNGLLSFGSNRIAVVADGVLIAGFIATVLSLIITKGYGTICYIFIAITVFSFCLHCILNGRIYFHAKNQSKVRQVLESKKESTSEKGEGKK